jgi:hypothetical protein
MQNKYSQWKFGLVLGIGALIALVLCVQCVRTYLYTDDLLVPQQAEHEAVRQMGALSAAARNAEVSDARALQPLMRRTVEAASDRVLWMRVVDLKGNVIARAGRPEGSPRFPTRWWDRVEKHEQLGTVIETQQGRAWVVMLPLRLGRPPRGHESKDGRHGMDVLEVAISLEAVADAFAGLRDNLVLGLIASIALLLSLAVIALRAKHYVRGKYLESELQLAKRVQSDLQPKPASLSPHVEFAAQALAADHVGGDFYDIFEAESGNVAIVLGDVSGKGMPAALLVSVLHGAIRSSTALEHEVACERINRMLCERTACERFATLFWGVFDPASNYLRYVNAGHCAPMLLRQNGRGLERLREGGPVLGMLPNARYTAGTVKIEDGDKLIIFSDGIVEAANESEEEFGETRVAEIICHSTETSPEAMCERIVSEVEAFAGITTLQDDRTLLVVKLSSVGVMAMDRKAEEIAIAAMA